MIESILQVALTGIGELFELIVTLVLSCISFDTAQFADDFPIAQALYTVLQGVGFGLVFGICIFQLVKFFAGPLTESTETPLRICARCLIACACILIGNYGLVAVCNLFSYPYADMLVADGVQLQLGSIVNNITADGGAGILSIAGDAAGIATSGISSVAMLLFALIVLILLAWNLIKLILEVVERYLVLMTIIYTSPLGWATISSEATAGIFKKWLSMFFSQCIMMLLNVWSFKVIISVLGTGAADDSTWFIRLILGLAFCKVAQRMDTYLNQLGANPAITGQNMLDDIVAVSKFGHAMGIGGTESMVSYGKKILGKAGNKGGETPTPGVDNLGGGTPPPDMGGTGGGSPTSDDIGASGIPAGSAGAAAAGAGAAAFNAATAAAGKAATAFGETGKAGDAASFDSYAKGAAGGNVAGANGQGDTAPLGANSVGEEMGSASRLSPTDMDVMRAAMAENGGAAPTAEQLENARNQAALFNRDLDNAGLHMDENGQIAPNGHTTGTYDVGKFAGEKAGATAVGDSAIARTIAGSGTLGKQIAQDAIMNSENPIHSNAVGAAAAAAILSSAKGGVSSLNAAEGPASAIGGLGGNAIQDAAAGIDGNVSADVSGGPAGGVPSGMVDAGGESVVSGGVSPMMNEDGSVVNGANASAPTMDAEGNVVNGSVNAGAENATDGGNLSDPGNSNANTADGNIVSNTGRDGESVVSGSTVQSNVESGSVDYEQFTAALNATASGIANAETGSVSDMIAGNGEIVGTYNPPVQQIQAVDPSTGAPLYNDDGSPKMESTPAVSSQPKNFSIMSGEAWNKLPAEARAGYTAFTTEGGKEFRVKMTDAKVASEPNAGMNPMNVGMSAEQTGKTLGGGGKSRNKGRGNRRRK